MLNQLSFLSGLLCWVSYCSAQHYSLGSFQQWGGTRADAITKVLEINNQIWYFANFRGQVGDLESYGKQDIVIMRYSKYQQFLNTAHLGSSSTDCLEVATKDIDHNVYLSGTFSDTLYYEAKALMYSKNKATFWIKLNTKGEVLWTKKFKSTYLVKDIYADKEKNLYLTGYYLPHFDQEGKNWRGTHGNTVFLHKWNQEGELLWSKQYTQTRSTAAQGLSITEQAASIYLAGEFRGDLALEDTLIQASPSHYALFLFKFDKNTGQRIWWKRFAGVYDNHCVKILSDPINNTLYLAGHFEGVLDWGTAKNVTAFVYKDIYVACLDTSGAHQWSVQSNTHKSHLYLRDMVYKNASLYLGGSFEQEAVLGQLRQEASNKTDAYWTVCDTAGNFLHLEGVHSNENSFVSTLAVTEKRVYMAGAFQDALEYLPDQKKVSSRGSYDAFLLSYRIEQRAEQPADNMDLIAAHSLAFNLKYTASALLIQLPDTENTTIAWTVYNLKGEQCAEGSSLSINTEILQSGTYSLVLRSGTKVGIKKITIKK